MGKRKTEEITIINKFNEKSSVDVKKSIENAFKLFYSLIVSKNKI